MNATITNPFNLVLFILGTFLSVSLGLFLLFNKSAKNRANLYLGGILITNAIQLNEQPLTSI